LSAVANVSISTCRGHRERERNDDEFHGICLLRPIVNCGMKALLWILVPAALFAIIAIDVVNHGPLSADDGRIADWLHSHTSPLLTQLMLGWTHLHDQVAILAYSAILVVFLAWQRDWRWVWAVALVVPAGLEINYGIKLLMQRARPAWTDPLLTLRTYSFPSGHTAGAMLFYGVLTAFLLSRLKNRKARSAVVITAVALIALVAFSRMYLGVHYLSDVLAAVAASGAWLALCLFAVHAWFDSRRR
jgi:membrane-associated phospholipid phosphatase